MGSGWSQAWGQVSPQPLVPPWGAELSLLGSREHFYRAVILRLGMIGAP